MVKKICIFSDGTGNSSAKAQKTNVWRTFQALDQTKPDQIAKYDNGVGTSSNKYLAAIGGAFGWGLKRNVLDLYKFVCRNYEKDDDIYGFGFSRGAFTIRVLVDLIATEGLVTFRSEEELNRNAAAAYRHYRAKKFPSWSPFVVGMRWLRDALIWIKDHIKGYSSYREVAGRAEIPIRFLGLWDTVEAYGVPIGELKRGIDWVLWPMVFGDLILSPRVQRACHGLSLDDERATFHPLLWDETAEARMVANHEVPPGRITQVWFAGVHSNVGGGYPEDQLSLVSLDWMMGEATASGLRLDVDAVAEVARAKSPYARLHDSRAGFASYYRYAPRRIPEQEDKDKNPILPIVHGSVVTRMVFGADRYAPISLPHQFWALAPDGQLLAVEATPQLLRMDATKRLMASVQSLTKSASAVSQEKLKLQEAIKALARPDRSAVGMVWDTVFWRRSLYWVTFALTVLLLAFPWVGAAMSDASLAALKHVPWIGDDLVTRWEGVRTLFNRGSRGPISTVVDLLSGLLPSYASPWITALEQHPLEFALTAAGIFVSLLGSNVLDARIHDRAWLAWHRAYRADYGEWIKEAQKGWRNALLVTFAIAILFLALSLLRHWGELIQIELSLFVTLLIALLAVRTIAILPAPASKSGTTTIESTFAMAFARWLRYSRLLRSLDTLIFERTVPILFALLLVVLGLLVANRVLFDVASASGYFCKGSIPSDARGKELIGTSAKEFRTDEFCWASGLRLEEGHRYRITLTTPGDWFDYAVRTDVAGFPADNAKFVAATLLKRWWTANWFKPIARIGEIGNDEYAMSPIDDFEKHAYPPCAHIADTLSGGDAHEKIGDDVARALTTCAPTPDERRTVVTDIRARTTGELFVYVNDAVFVWPGRTELFFGNNRGTGSITVERITGPAAATR